MNYIFSESSLVKQEDRLKDNCCTPHVLWLFGLSGSGKTTLAKKLELKLFNELSKKVVWLDGDTLRKGINSNLGFDDKDRDENIRRSSEVAKLFIETGHIVIASFITPLNRQRETVLNILNEKASLVYVETSIEECKRRDPKNLYQMTNDGKIENMTGVKSRFELPSIVDLTIKTEKSEVDELVNLLFDFLKEKTSKR